MGRPKAREGSRATDELLLRAAEVEFARKGFDATRLEDIASAVGIRRPSLLYHYGSKQKLYEAVVQATFQELGAAFADAMGFERSFPERFGAIIDSLMDFFERRPSVPRLILREILDETGPGNAMLLSVGVPLLETVTSFMEEEGEAYLRPGLPVRQACLNVFTSACVATSAGSLRTPFYGDDTHVRALARHLFLREAYH